MSDQAERLFAILDSLGVGVVAVDPEGRTELQNAEASRILGISARVTRGKRLEECLGSNHPAPPLLAQALQDQREITVHACSIRPHLGSTSMLVDFTASPIGVGDRVEGAVLTLKDHTIGRELESLVDQRNRSELFAKLAAGFAHEVRNPLGGIRGAAQLLLGRLEDAKNQRYPELIRDETDRILRLLDGMAEFTHGGDLRIKRVNLHQVLDNLIELHGQEDGWSQIEVVREYDPSIPELELDPDRITQIFLNLVQNAVQAIAGSGRLLIRTRVEAQFQLSPGEEKPVRMVSTDIEDSGPGIPDEDLQHIFTPFFTRRQEGTGLGLAVTQHWAVRHGGRIKVSSLDEGGTRFTVQLPVRRDS